MTEQKHFDKIGHLTSDVVSEVIDERVKVYGDPTVTFPQIAQVWSGYLGHEIKPEDVPMMMILMKSVRARQAPDYSDNTDDIEGYLDIYRKLVPGMIHARSVDDYIEKKATARRDAEHAANMYLDVVAPRESNIVVPELEPEPERDLEGAARVLHMRPQAAAEMSTSSTKPCLEVGYHLSAQRHNRNDCPVGHWSGPEVSEVRGHERKLYTSAGCTCGLSFASAYLLERHIENANDA